MISVSEVLRVFEGAIKAEVVRYRPGRAKCMVDK